MLGDLSRDFRYAARSLRAARVHHRRRRGARARHRRDVGDLQPHQRRVAEAAAVRRRGAPRVAVDRSLGGRRAGRVEVTPGHYVDWRERAQSFEEMTLIESVSVNLTGDGGEPERLSGLRTTPNLFATIGLAPLLGRTFGPTRARESVVVSEGFWLRRLGGDPAVVGRTITLDGSPHTVVGVVPRDFRFPYREQDVYIATVFSPKFLAQRGKYSWYTVAKLRPTSRSRRRAPRCAPSQRRSKPRARPRAAVARRRRAAARPSSRGPSRRRSWRCSARSGSCC